MIELPPGLHGAFRRTNLVSRLGLPAVRQIVRDGLLTRYSRNVLVERRRMLELPTRAAAALLHVGPRSALTTHTAALVYGCTAADPTAIHVLCDANRAAAARLRGRADLRAARGRVLLELATGLPESPAESEMLLALYDAGLPIPTLQHSVRAPTRLTHVA